jgi:hypothetical protein
VRNGCPVVGSDGAPGPIAASAAVGIRRSHADRLSGRNCGVGTVERHPRGRPRVLRNGGFVAAAGIGTAECAGGDDDDAASDAQMNTPTRWATNPLLRAPQLRGEGVGRHCAQFDAVPGLDCRLACSIPEQESNSTRPKRRCARPTRRRRCRSPPRHCGSGIVHLGTVRSR